MENARKNFIVEDDKDENIDETEIDEDNELDENESEDLDDEIED
jgi:hypothetical protein